MNNKPHAAANVSLPLTHLSLHLVNRFGLSTAVLGATFLLTGCSMLSYTGPAGERFSRLCFGSKTAIASLSVEAGTNGVRRVELQGYQSDANQALGTVTEAAVRAAAGR